MNPLDFYRKLAVFLIAILLTAFGVWKYQAYKYELEIEQIKTSQLETINEYKTELIKQERANDNTIAKINSESLAKDKKINELRVSNNSLRTERGGLLVQANSCQDSGITSQAPNTDNAGNSQSTGGICELPRSTSELIAGTFYEVDRLRNVAQVCKQYAEEIEKQRERLSKHE